MLANETLSCKGFHNFYTGFNLYFSEFTPGRIFDNCQYFFQMIAYMKVETYRDIRSFTTGVAITSHSLITFSKKVVF